MFVATSMLFRVGEEAEIKETFQKQQATTVDTGFEIGDCHNSHAL
jgi:hypothetical protein